MKLSDEKQSEVVGSNNSGKKMDFKIGDMSRVIKMLSTLYANPIQTLTQEYLCNGRDATRETGKETPLMVTLPTKLDPILKIRDYGVGLSEDRVQNVFIAFGVSTKNDTDDQTGGFGLGAKSAFAYTDSFMVTSWHGGKKTTYVAHTGEKRSGTLEILGESKSDEPTGVEIQVSVNEEDINKFVSAVFRTTLFWDVRPVLKGITEVEIPSYYKDLSYLIKGDGWKIVDGGSLGQYFSTKNNSRSGLVFNVDGVPYQLGRQHLDIDFVCDLNDLVGGSKLLILDASNAEIEVQFSREGIENHAEGRKKIKNTCEKYIAILNEKIKSQLESSTNFLELAQNRAIINKATGSDNDLTANLSGYDVEITSWGDVKSPILDYFELKKFDLVTRKNETIVLKEYKYHNPTIKITKNNTVFVINDSDEGKINLSAKVKKQLLDNDQTTAYVFVNKTANAKVLKDFNKLFSPVYTTKLEKPLRKYSANGSSKKGKKAERSPEITVHVLGDGCRYSSFSKNTKKVNLETNTSKFIYIPFEEINHLERDYQTNMGYLQFFAKHGVEIVAIKPTHLKRITEDTKFTTFTNATSNIKTEYPVTDALIYSAISGELNASIVSIKDAHLKHIEDQEFLALYNIFKEAKSGNRRGYHRGESNLRKIVEMHFKDRVTVAKKKITKINNDRKKMLEKYPLLSKLSTWDDFGLEVVEYINLKHNTAKNTVAPKLP